MMNTILLRVMRTASEGPLDRGTSLVSQEEALQLASLPASEMMDLLTTASFVRLQNRPDTFTCGISNAKSGRCPENCAFCAQSVHYDTGVVTYPLQSEDVLLRRAEALAEAGAIRFGIVTSGTALSDADLDRLCCSAERIRREVGIGLCGSLGQLTLERGRCLRDAGFSGYHHNLETSASHFPAICTSHAYEEDLETVRIARSVGFRVCSGGIFGLGETWEQRIELSKTLMELDVDSIPVNFLNPIPGTPLENAVLLAPEEALRCLAVIRLLHPSRDIVVCGGRERILKEWQSWLFAAGANGLMTGNYLTTTGNSFDVDTELMRTLGLR